MFNLDLRIAGHLARAVIGLLGESARELVVLPPASLPSGNQYLQFQNLFTSDSDEHVAWTGVRSMALIRNARLRVRGSGHSIQRPGRMLLDLRARWSFWQWESRCPRSRAHGQAPLNRAQAYGKRRHVTP